jgi:hypothetical protein
MEAVHDFGRGQVAAVVDLAPSASAAFFRRGRGSRRSSLARRQRN